MKRSDSEAAGMGMEINIEEKEGKKGEKRDG